MRRERWRDIEGWHRHQVSDWGRVRALPGAIVNHRLICETELRDLHLNQYGYLRICKGSRKFGTFQSLVVHRLVLIAFRGLPLARQVTRHLNGIQTDNRLSNLRWGSSAENYADQVAHGTNYNRFYYGERHGVAKLKEIEVKAILKAKGLHREIAQKFGVSRQTVSGILRRETWTHVEG